jgi:hypothetical protein
MLWFGYLKERHAMRLETLATDYDPVTRLDEFGDTNESEKENEEFIRLTLADLEPALANWEARRKAAEDKCEAENPGFKERHKALEAAFVDMMAEVAA